MQSLLTVVRKCSHNMKCAAHPPHLRMPHTASDLVCNAQAILSYNVHVAKADLASGGRGETNVPQYTCNQRHDCCSLHTMLVVCTYQSQFLLTSSTRFPWKQACTSLLRVWAAMAEP